MDPKFESKRGEGDENSPLSAIPPASQYRAYVDFYDYNKLVLRG